MNNKKCVAKSNAVKMALKMFQSKKHVSLNLKLKSKH